MRKGIVVKFFIGLAVLAVLAILLILFFYAEEDWRGWHDWNHFKEKREAKGEHLSFASVVPPPVPADKNFALTPIVFSSYGFVLTRNGKKIPYNKNFDQRMDISVVHGYQSFPAGGIGNWKEDRFSNLAAWQSYYRHLAEKTNEFPMPTKPGSPAADVLMALSKYAPVIKALRKASQLPDSRYPLNYKTACPAKILLPHLPALKNCSQVLQLRSLAELQNDESKKAMQDVLLALQLSDKVRSEPFLITQLVRIVMVENALQPIWEGLAKHKWSEPQLARLNTELASLDFLADYQRTIRGELAMKDSLFGFMRHHRSEILSLLGTPLSMGNNKPKPWRLGSILCELLPSGWFYQNQLRCARMLLDYYLPIANPKQGTFSPAAAKRAKNKTIKEGQTITPYNVFERMLVPTMSGAARRFAYAQASVALARTAIALERYRLAHGAYPKSLDVLAPQFTAKLPHDVIGGQPLHYRRTRDGQFVLYSVGWNESDDDGTVAYYPHTKPPRLNITQGDWVWRYPGK